MSNLLPKLAPVEARYEELSALLADGASGDKYVKMMREYASLGPVMETINNYKAAVRQFEEAEVLMSDPEMKELAQAEYYELKEKLPELEHQLKLALIPRDTDDTKNAILEIRAGTGGDEAALFAGDLLSMYHGYAQQMGWKFVIAESAQSDLGGYKEVIVEVSGSDVFSKLKFESGVHRVQRVPATETQGRVHTSAATVAVMPEAEEVDIVLNDKDLKFDVFRSQGSGGQSVNTTDSAVRVTHIPTGIAIAIQEEKSQHKNKARAISLLKTKLYDLQRQKLDQERAADRKSQVGSGDRSERIRTYNFPQGRVSDHRINLTVYNIENVMTGKALDEIVDALVTHDQAERLASLNL
ncbi:MAG: peptide chain release factor 1 [Micavibrio aeruginosavorus]|uniref:Peptide chain release factor 1 n=1 Tax=Micavibrio aeruginosavorus TaxID=349221 RepID=A0A2W5H570_9BACT|nr:MAG: peptide chain release factor 1 [Micavibrio aeruginosavorus]